MQRRAFVTTAFCLAWARQGRAQEPAQPPSAEPQAEAEPPPERPHHTVSLRQILATLDTRFPLQRGLPGMLELLLQTPRLRLLPAQDRMAAEFDLTAFGSALTQPVAGSLALDFALRLQASDRSIRAWRIRPLRLLVPTLQSGLQALLQRQSAALAQQLMFEVVLYRLQERDLALADAMGLQPDSVHVTEDGVDIGFSSKPAP